jgi:DNA-binding MarR family transcriptional regulator
MMRPNMVKRVPTSGSYSMEDRRHLDKATSLFQAFRSIDSTMPLQLAYTFILCATYEGESVGDIARRAGFAVSTTSRHILDLGEYDRAKKPGFQLVETRTDPMELRRKTVHLTPKGRNLLNQIISTMRL